MEKLTKQEIINKIEETQKKSSILKGELGLNRIWTINELVYCLEFLSFKEDLNLTICNESDGMCIPCQSCGLPLWLNCETRAKKVKIVDIEVEEFKKDFDDDYEYSDEICSKEVCYAYLIIVKEV